MNHSEAVEQMATERYLLDELSPDLRDAFEEHLFDCPDCSLDLCAAAAFVEEAKVQLPELTRLSAGLGSQSPSRQTQKKSDWLGWLRPAFANPLVAGPIFAALLVFVGYQNLVTYPALRSAASEPHLLPWTSLHAGTRGGAHTTVEADRKQGAILLVDLPQQPSDLAYSSYAFSLYDPQGKLAWTRTAPVPQKNAADDGTYSLLIPGTGLQQGAYTLSVSGIDSQGKRTETERQVFDIHFSE
jgi:hypothetical protein